MVPYCPIQDEVWTLTLTLTYVRHYIVVKKYVNIPIIVMVSRFGVVEW